LGQKVAGSKAGQSLIYCGSKVISGQGPSPVNWHGLSVWLRMENKRAFGQESNKINKAARIIFYRARLLVIMKTILNSSSQQRPNESSFERDIYTQQAF